jgi:hypothetical protein
MVKIRGEWLVTVMASTLLMGVASAGPITPAGCATCTLDAQNSTDGATPFTLVNLGTGTPNSRQAITGPISVPGETISFPATGSGVYAGTQFTLFLSPFAPIGIGNSTTNYLAAMPGDSGVTITFASPQHEFDLLWGSVDPDPATYNQLVFNFGGGNTVTGADVMASFAADGLVFIPGLTNAAVEITTVNPFTTVTATASNQSFEFVPAAVVPEPGSSIVLLSMALAVLFSTHRVTRQPARA